jgi:hypothetical protein
MVATTKAVLWGMDYRMFTTTNKEVARTHTNPQQTKEHNNVSAGEQA